MMNEDIAADLKAKTQRGERGYKDHPDFELPPPSQRYTSANHDALHRYVAMDGRITPEGEDLVQMAFNVLGAACFRNSHAHGWYDNVDQPSQRNFGEICSLFTSEISEAFEEHRKGERYDTIYYTAKEIPGMVGPQRWEGPPEINGVLGKPEGIPVELADLLIRLFDSQEALKIPLAKALLIKHEFNYSRPYRHGNKRA